MYLFQPLNNAYCVFVSTGGYYIFHDIVIKEKTSSHKNKSTDTEVELVLVDLVELEMFNRWNKTEPTFHHMHNTSNIVAIM